MAEKIKNLFKKKVQDAKFKRAGKGYKLNDSSSSSHESSSSKAASASIRHEPTNEARIAGQAALARLEGAKSNAPKFNTSYAAIQARAKKELEQERLAMKAELESNALASTATTEETDTVHLLAVKDVYFRCPLVSDELLPKEEWYSKIEDFFSAQLADDEEGLSACLIIHSCNDGVGRINSCVETLTKYLDNIQNNPSETKFWKIRMSNKVFQEKVKPIRGALEFLKAAGFIQEKLNHQDNEEDFLVWSPERCTIAHLTMLSDALNSSESVQLVLDRNVSVLLPSDAAKQNELPAAFYVLTSDEIKREQNERTKTMEQSQMLMTQAMREKFMKQKERKYRYTLIRIRFPDNIILQGTFAVNETYQEVVQFVKEHLFDDEFPFYLITATREKLADTDFEKTLESLNLVPAVVLTFFWDSSSGSETPSRFLK